MPSKRKEKLVAVECTREHAEPAVVEATQDARGQWILKMQCRDCALIWTEIRR